MPGQKVPTVYQWKPSDVVAHLRDTWGVRVGTVIDLTMSRRYYKPDEFLSLGIQHIKIPCRGHGQVPEAKHVNLFVWEVRKAQKLAQDVWEQVRCQPSAPAPLPPEFYIPVISIRYRREYPVRTWSRRSLYQRSMVLKYMPSCCHCGNCWE